ncbi:MAG: element excision factor XisH family protein, partial [Bacteroidota bacterium]
MARDKYHFIVRDLLEQDGWTISHDPYFIRLGKRKGFVDLGAERIILGAEKGNLKIAVEIKSFLGISEVDQFEDALGQFLLYRPALQKNDPERVLWLALPSDFYSNLFEDSYFQEIA